MFTTPMSSLMPKALAPSRKFLASSFVVLPTLRRSTLCVLTALLALLTAISLPAAAPLAVVGQKVQPQLWDRAVADPDATFAVIIQKTEPSYAAEAMTVALGGVVTQDLSILNGFAAQLPGVALLQLATDPLVRWISLDGPVIRSEQDKGSPGKPALPNTYLDTLGVRALWQKGLHGEGIGIAVIDSGISKNKDFSNLEHSGVFSQKAKDKVDFFGHGTHVAGIIAGNGANSKGLYRGIAPAATLYDLKIGNDVGMAYESDIVKALQWVYKNHVARNIRVVNLSFNATVEQAYHTSPMSAAAEVLWFNGVVVVVSVGNKAAGGYNTANAAPAHDPFLITVGAMDEQGTPNSNDDTLASYSAAGVSSTGLAKPDLVAPGSKIVSVLSKQSDWDEVAPDRVVNNAYFRLSGTSMAAPMVTGAVALLLQDEPNLTPDQVKYRLLNSGSRWVDPGNGVLVPYLNIYNAVTGATTQSANTGLPANQLLWTGSQPVAWNSVSWNSVSWNSVSWNSVSWNSVSWNSVSWNSDYWGDGATSRAVVITDMSLPERATSAIDTLEGSDLVEDLELVDTPEDSDLVEDLPLADTGEESDLVEDLPVVDTEPATDASFKVLLPLILR